MGQKDKTEKMLLNYNDVFADIVDVLLFNGTMRIKPNQLQDAQTKAQFKAAGMIRESERDVSKIWLKNHVRIALVGIENQTEPDETMPIRVAAYDGVSYQTQLLDKDKKTKKPKALYPVITLVLYFGEKRWKYPKTLHEMLKVPKELRPYVTNHKLLLFEVAYLKPEQVALFTSDFRSVAEYFTQKRVNGTQQFTKRFIQHVEAVLELLKAVTNDPRFADPAFANDLMQQKTSKGVAMEAFLDRCEARGEARGRAEGRAERDIEIARNLFNDGIPVEVIAKNTGLTVAQVKALGKKKASSRRTRHKKTA